MADLKITIGADLNAAIAQVAALSAGVTELSNSAGAAASTTAAMFAKIPASIRLGGASGEIKNLAAAVKQLKVDAAGFKTPIIPPIPPIPPALVPELKKIPSAVNGAGQSLTDFSRILQDAPFGFIGIQNNIPPLIDSFTRLKTSTGSTGGALRALVTGAGGIGGVGLAVSAITAAVTFASIGFDRWAPKVKAVSKETKDLQDASEGVVKAMAEETSRIAVLVNAITSDTLSKKQRNGAIVELQRLNPDYFGALDKEKAKIGEVSAAYANYTFNLKEQFKTKALSKQLDELFDKKLKLEIELDPQANTINDPKLTAARNKLQNEIDKLGGLKILPQGNNVDISKLTEDQQKVLSLQRQLDAVSNIRLFDTSGKSKELAEINTQISGLIGRLGQAGSGNLNIKPGGTDPKDIDALKTAISNLEAYRDRVGLTNAEFTKLIGLREQLVRRDASKLGLDAGQLEKEVVAIRNSNEQLESRAKALEEVAKSTALVTGEKADLLNLKVGIVLNEQTVGKLDLSQTQRTLDELALKAGLRLPLTIAFDDDIKARIMSQVGELPLIGKPIVVPTVNLGVKEAIKNINTELAATPIILPSVDDSKLKVGLDKSLKETAAALQRVNDTIKSAITDSIVGLGEAIGTALGTGNIQSALSVLAGTIAGGLKQIGTAMIAYGTAKLLFDQALKSLNPAVAIVAGVGLVAAGSALQAAISQRKFATGGIVTGPTNGLIGEAGPEVIFPLNQLKKFLPNMAGASSGSQVFIPDIKIEGSTLRIVLNRDTNRAGGSYNF